MQWTVRVDSATYGESDNLNTRPYISTHLKRTYTNPGSKVNGISTKKLNKLHSQGVDEGTQQGGNRTVEDPTRLGRRKTLPGGEVKYPFKIATSLNFHHQENSGGRVTAYHIQWMAANRTWDEVYAGENAMVVEIISLNFCLQKFSMEPTEQGFIDSYNPQVNNPWKESTIRKCMSGEPNNHQYIFNCCHAVWSLPDSRRHQELQHIWFRGRFRSIIGG